MKRTKQICAFLLVAGILTGCADAPKGGEKESETDRPRITKEAGTKEEEGNKETEQAGTESETVIETSEGETATETEAETESPSGTGEAAWQTASLKQLPYLTGYGRIVSYEEDLWFVQPGFDNDGTENGTYYSENIYRMDQNGKIDEIAVVPQCMTFGIAQTTVMMLIPAKDRVYFLRKTTLGNRRVLSYAKLSSGEIFDIAMPEGKEKASIRSFVSRTENAAYFNMLLTNEEEDHETFCMKLDLLTGECSVYEPEIPLKEGAFQVLTGFYEDGLCYMACNEEYEPVKLQYAPFDKSGELTLVEIKERDDDIRLCAIGDYIGILDNGKNELELIRQEDKESCFVLTKDDLSDERVWTMTDDTLYYANSDDKIVALDLESRKETQMETGEKGNRILYLTAGEQLYLVTDDELTVKQITADKKLQPLLQRQSYEEISGTWEGWAYAKNSKGVEINGYDGTETDLTIPQEIDGVPVLFVSLYRCLPEKGSLSIPDSVVGIERIEDQNVTRLILPESLLYLTLKNWRCTLAVAPDAVIEYQGTKAQWEELITRSKELYDGVSVESYPLRCPEVICKDGRWGNRVTVITSSGEVAVLLEGDTMEEALLLAGGISLNRKYQDDTYTISIDRVGFIRPDTSRGESFAVTLNGRKVEDINTAILKDGDEIKIELIRP